MIIVNIIQLCHHSHNHQRCHLTTANILDNSMIDQSPYSPSSLLIELMETNFTIIDSITTTYFLQELSPGRSCFTFIIQVQRIDMASRSEGEDLEWVVERQYHEFYSLQSALVQYHGIFDDAKLPPR